MRAILVKPGGISPEEVEVDGAHKHASLPELYKVIDCSMIQQVRICGKAPDPHKMLEDPVMLVDEEAALKPFVRINYQASWLFGFAWHSMPLRGNALLVSTDGLGWTSLPPAYNVIVVEDMIEERRNHGL
jgi:hypothetical protein